ncbi:MFS transporter [Nocardiopsis sp. NPDC058631]|uniref:MFS transporter n=1 Tax=Nocardiopsis sp. NPDC058631 TaxID=3346566 RepID=UPI00364E2059
MDSPLRATLTSRAFWSYSLVAALCRAPALMIAVAATTTSLLLTGRIDTGALMTTCHVLGTLAATPFAARVVGRWPARRVLGTQMAAHGLLWLAVWAAVGTGQPEWSWHACAALAGTAIAGSGGVIRSQLPRTVPEGAARSASTVDVTFMDLLIFLAPLAVAAAAPTHPLGPIAAVAVISLVAVAVLPFAGLPDSAAPVPTGTAAGHGDGTAGETGTSTVPAAPSPEYANPRPARTGKHRLRWNTAAVSWILFGAAIGLYFAAVEVGATALVVSYGFDAGTAWTVFLVLSAASVAGGYLDAARTPGRREAAWASASAALLVAGCLLLASGPSLPVAVLALTLSGLPVAALLGLRSHMIDVAVPEAQRAGYLSWAFAAQNLGFAAGSTLLAVLGQPVLLVLASLTTAAVLVAALRLSPPSRERVREESVPS